MYSCDYYWIRTGSFKTLEYVLEMQGEGARGLQESLGHATAPPGPSREAKKQITVGAQGFAWHGLYVVHGEKSEPQQASSDTVFTEAVAIREYSREDCW